MIATVAFWLLFLGFVAAFAAQVATRVRIIAAGADNFSIDRYVFGTGAVTFAPAIIWRGVVDGTSNSIHSTPGFFGGLPGNLGPNFIIPAPGAAGLLAVGLFAHRRR